MSRSFFSYLDIENMLERFVVPLRERHCDVVVAILRGGIFPAHFLANELGLPMQFIQVEREAGTVTMFGDVAGKRVLLVDDTCCSGRTIAPCKAWLEAQGCEVITCAIFSVRPMKVDYAVEAEPAPAQEWVLPWERRIFTPAGRALNTYSPQDDWHMSFYAFDLDGVFVRDVPQEEYDRDLQAALAHRDGLLPLRNVPLIDYANAAIITSRPKEDASRTHHWWSQYFPPVSMHFRDAAQYSHSPEDVARYKAETAIVLGATHFIESNLEIATMIALHAPMLKVQWLDAHMQDAVTISTWRVQNARGPVENIKRMNNTGVSVGAINA